MSITDERRRKDWNPEVIDEIIKECYNKGMKLSSNMLPRAILFNLLSNLGVSIECFHCGEPNPELAHIISLRSGGKAIDLSNLIFLCKKCHHKYDGSNTNKKKRGIHPFISESIKSKICGKIE
jgi:5-methylcytosine-specific restriction endonuclease McrA